MVQDGDVLFVVRRETELQVDPKQKQLSKVAQIN